MNDYIGYNTWDIRNAKKAVEEKGYEFTLNISIFMGILRAYYQHYDRTSIESDVNMLIALAQKYNLHIQSDCIDNMPVIEILALSGAGGKQNKGFGGG